MPGHWYFFQCPRWLWCAICVEDRWITRMSFYVRLVQWIPQANSILRCPPIAERCEIQTKQGLARWSSMLWISGGIWTNSHIMRILRVPVWDLGVRGQCGGQHKPLLWVIFLGVSQEGPALNSLVGSRETAHSCISGLLKLPFQVHMMVRVQLP